MLALRGSRKVGVPCSAPDEALEHIALFGIWASLLFPKILGSFWAQMPGIKKDKEELAKTIPTYTYQWIHVWQG